MIKRIWLKMLRFLEYFASFWLIFCELTHSLDSKASICFIVKSSVFGIALIHFQVQLTSVLVGDHGDEVYLLN